MVKYGIEFKNLSPSCSYMMKTDVNQFKWAPEPGNAQTQVSEIT